MAKWGASGDTRRLLGYHSNPNEQSLLTYSRDAAAGPLKEMAAMILAIKTNMFRPDESRFGRIGAFEGSGLDTEAAHTLSMQRRAEATDVPAGGGSSSSTAPQGAQQEAAAPPDPTSSSSSSSSSEAESAEARVEASVTELALGPPPRAEAAFDASSMFLYKHKVVGTLHLRLKSQVTRLVCGRSLHAGFCRMANDTVLTARCSQCFTSKSLARAQSPPSPILVASDAVSTAGD